jgi:putative ABC transport system permease protein
MIWDAILLAIRELQRNLMRALLTTLGIVIGVSSVIAMVTLGNGATASISDQIASLGRNALMLTPQAPQGNGPPIVSRSFNQADVIAVRREVAHLRGVSPEANASATVVAANHNHTTQVTGGDEGYFIVHDTVLVMGRPFNDVEVRSGRAVCILGETVRKNLFGTGDPIGQQVRVKNVPCQVIGLLVAKGTNTFGQDQDNVMLMPLKAVQRRLNGNDNISSIWLAVDTAENVTRVIKDTQRLMRERRRVGEGERDNFQVNDLAQITQTISQVTGVMTLFLAAVAGVSLLVGGIGIMNIMLVSVTERTREIGIRLAIGAREKDVLTQFLVEAMMMSILGGIIGILLGLGISYAGATALSFRFIPSPFTITIAFLFSAAIGIGFGFFPARKAARLDPIEALRHE